MSRALDTRLQTALTLAAGAGALAMRLRPPPGAPSAATLKGAQDWLTEADAAVERFLADGLAAAFPEDGFVGEESGRSRAGTLRWVADPIDGTSNFARGGARFCVSLGLIEDRTPLLGVVVAPALGETFAGRAGGGATLNGVPLRAADTVSMDRAMIEAGWSPRCPTPSFLAMAQSIIGAGAAIRSSGSGALALADIAAGRLDGYIEAHINLWDVAAALVLLQEAGAHVSPFMAGTGPDTGAPIVAAAPGIAAMLTQIAVAASKAAGAG